MFRSISHIEGAYIVISKQTVWVIKDGGSEDSEGCSRVRDESGDESRNSEVHNIGNSDSSIQGFGNSDNSIQDSTNNDVTNNDVTNNNNNTNCYHTNPHTHTHTRQYRFDSCISGVSGQYLVLENKEILKYNGHSKDFQAYTKALKTPTAIISVNITPSDDGNIDSNNIIGDNNSKDANNTPSYDVNTTPNYDGNPNPNTTPSQLYIADRAGCVYSVLPSNTMRPEILFGSISMLTGISLTTNYIVTIDKDSKIRITHRKNPRYIEDFVMVHSRPLTSTTVVLDRYIVSGGYDAYVSIYDTIDRVTAIYDLKSGTTVKYTPVISDLPGIEDQRSIHNTTQGTPESPSVQAITRSHNWVLILTNGKIILLEISSNKKEKRTEHKEETLSFSIQSRTVEYPQPILDVSGIEKSVEPKFIFISDTGHLSQLLVSHRDSNPNITEITVIPEYKRDPGLSLIAQGKVLNMHGSGNGGGGNAEGYDEGYDEVDNASDTTNDDTTDSIPDDVIPTDN